MNQNQYDALRKFPDQLEYVLEKYTAHGLKTGSFRNIIIAGLGGSGIGGQIIKNWFIEKLSLPLEVVSDYSLPAYADANTLLILCSYSGNTEETLEICADGSKRGCRMLTITTGGKLAELSQAAALPVYFAEKGFQPRMALGYPLGYLLLIFSELLGELDAMKTELKTVADRTREQASDYEEDSLEMLEELKKHSQNKFVIVTDRALQAVGVRFAQQINENSKHEAFQHTLPEANHNVIESYYGTIHSAFFFLRSGHSPRVETRFDFLSSLLEVEYHKVVSLVMEKYDLGSLIAMIYRLDALSLQLADQRNVNATNIANIDSLKEFLEGFD